jgi:hypothetical protein
MAQVVTSPRAQLEKHLSNVFGKRGATETGQLNSNKQEMNQMSRNYQREDRDRDWRRQQPSYQEEDQWSNNRSDDDFSMGLGQESRGSRGEDYGWRGQEYAGRSSGREGMRRAPGQYSGYGQREESGRGQQRFGSYRGRDSESYGPSDYRGSEMGWDQGNEGFQNTGLPNSSRWQRSQFRPSEGDFGGSQQYGPGRNTGGRTWYESNEPSGGRGWYEGQGQFAGRGPRNYKRSDDRIEEDLNERLTRHGMVDATDIEVGVQNGEVTLRGTVDSRQAKRIVEDIADAVSGVKEVTNQIKVKQRGEANERGETKHETETTGKQRKAS